MPTQYQINLIRRASIFVLLLILFTTICSNIISYFCFKHITVAPSSYIVKDGFPIFTSEEDYIEFVKNYPYDPGVQLTIYNVSPGETIWSIKKHFNITIDTLISANPHLKSLNIKDISYIIIPSKNGALFTFDDYTDISKMSSLMGDMYKISGDYRPKIYKLISPDDIRMVFFENAKPLIVNNTIEKLFRYKMTFIDPLDTGFYTSMFGDRVNPTFDQEMEFHNGVDIATKAGTPIKAVRAGIVFQASWKEGYGNTILIQHDDGYTTFYGHCLKMYVKQGQWVKQNEVIGTVGSTGRSTGSHLHYTVSRHGQNLNPLKFLW